MSVLASRGCEGSRVSLGVLSIHLLPGGGVSDTLHVCLTLEWRKLLWQKKKSEEEEAGKVRLM